MGSLVLFARMGFVDLVPACHPPPWSWCPALSLPGEVSGPWGVGFLLPLGQLGVPDAVGIWFGGGWAAPGAFVFVLCVLVGGARVFRVASPVLPWSGR